MIAKKGVFDTLARRFSVNQFLILAGCVLLLLSMAFTFTTSRFPSFNETVPIVTDDSFLLPFTVDSLPLPFSTHTSSMVFPSSQISTTTGFSMVFIINRWGFSIIHRSAFELLLPILMVVVATVMGTRIADSKLIALIASVVGLCFGLSLRISTFSSFMAAGIGLRAFVSLWVAIAVMAFLEYKDMHPLERRKNYEKAPGQTEV